MSNPFGREKEGSSAPRNLVDEALEHFRKAADQVDLPPDRLEEQRARAEEALRHHRRPSLPDLTPIPQT